VIDRSAGNESDQRVIRLASTPKDGVLSCGHGVCGAASRLPLEGAKMVATFKPSFGGSIFLIVALLAAARPDPAAASDRGAIPLQARTCMVGHRFEPGPIVGGHNRQPTVREFQARMAQLLEFEQRNADRCAEAPAGTEAIRQLSPAG
jgi:hypothetical protein